MHNYLLIGYFIAMALDLLICLYAFVQVHRTHVYCLHPIFIILLGGGSTIPVLNVMTLVVALIWLKRRCQYDAFGTRITTLNKP